MKHKYECLEDRCLIRPIKSKELEMTAGGIIAPDVKQKPVSKGEVISVGSGYTARDTGTFVPTYLHAGDVVLYGSGAGLPIEIDTEIGKEDVLVMREGDIFLLISKKSDT